MTSFQVSVVLLDIGCVASCSVKGPDEDGQFRVWKSLPSHSPQMWELVEHPLFVPSIQEDPAGS